MTKRVSYRQLGCNLNAVYVSEEYGVQFSGEGGFTRTNHARKEVETCDCSGSRILNVPKWTTSNLFDIAYKEGSLASEAAISIRFRPHVTHTCRCTMIFTHTIGYTPQSRPIYMVIVCR